MGVKVLLSFPSLLNDCLPAAESSLEKSVEAGGSKIMKQGGKAGKDSSVFAPKLQQVPHFLRVLFTTRTRRPQQSGRFVSLRQAK